MVEIQRLLESEGFKRQNSNNKHIAVYWHEYAEIEITVPLSTHFADFINAMERVGKNLGEYYKWKDK